MEKVISREDVYKVLDSLLKDFEVIGPREIPNKGIFYQALERAEDLYLGQEFTTEPIKKFFLEPSSWILKYGQDSRFNMEAVLPSEKRRIIIGTRPCETRGLTLLDKVFDPSTGSGSTLSEAERVDSDYKDNYYINNRKRTVIIGLACNKPDRSCFCTSMGGSPVEFKGMDALLFDAEDRFTPLEPTAQPKNRKMSLTGFIVEVITDKGKDIFGAIGEELKEIDKKSYQTDKENKRNLVQKKIMPPEGLDKIFEHEYWQEVCQPCLSCGICTYLCPTCHCFDLVDEERKRLRCYDGCAFADFTLQASGENPRPTKKERYRQRVFHKFDYFKKNFGENLCVGCGRCIRYCPVKMDIADIVDKAPVTQ